MRPDVTDHAFDVAVVGGGPAGLMAAETVARAGKSVAVFEKMPTFGRKFLMAGRGGLNLTHSEDFERFVGRYGARAGALAPMLAAFPPKDLVAWAEGLGQPTFVGASGRVFPKAMKASPLLRAWLARLEGLGVQLRTRAEWMGWGPDGGLLINGEVVRARAVVLALGGASWAKLGSDAAWVPTLEGEGGAVAPFRAANCGFDVAWRDLFRERFAGEPLKNLALRHGERVARGDAMVAGYGLEGGAVYALAASLRDAVEAEGRATLMIDLRPDLPVEVLERRLRGPRGGQSLANFLRKAVKLSPVEINLLREAHGLDLPSEPAVLAAAIKAAPIVLTGVQPLERAISAAGGVTFESLDGLTLKGRPDVILAGEMLDWEAPTGGYLLQACFATGVAAGKVALERLEHEIPLS
ncbi:MULTISPECIES: TIGR03862 family flavoprotein [unclassified Caulobacter]|uniref:TIGR03862 family flavoprotein n=1 Tax=unclassified Caulobacter TaxID=2648921 RepID=UPI0006FD94D0|nr:NAD(FAD)-utilizing dehydrogenase [Caulobacter sp. Root342]KQV71970.1 NAD(FAD)-utilizing dehydrogenase [Caulobacter sp. Root343]